MAHNTGVLFVSLQSLSIFWIYFRRNFLRLNVYFAELKYEYIEQQEAYVLSSFFSEYYCAPSRTLTGLCTI